MNSIQLYDLIALSIILFAGAACLIVTRAVYIRWRDKQRFAEMRRRANAVTEHPELEYMNED